MYAYHIKDDYLHGPFDTMEALKKDFLSEMMDDEVAEVYKVELIGKITAAYEIKFTLDEEEDEA